MTEASQLSAVKDERPARAADVATLIAADCSGGQIVELFACGITSDGTIRGYWTASDDLVRLIGALEYLKARAFVRIRGE